MSSRFRLPLAIIVCLAGSGVAGAQSMGTSGTVQGTVLDSTGAALPSAVVTLSNPITNYSKTVVTDPLGNFRFVNIPFNPYHVEVAHPGFTTVQQDISVRSSVPVNLKLTLEVAAQNTAVTVHAESADMVENVPYAHNDIDQSTYSKLPVGSPGSGLSDAITLGSPGVVADSNGFFHPLGDHAQTSFNLDGQPIGDQQSKQFSTQLPLNALQSMELITSAPGAEFGDKTSLVVNAVTKSGLGQKLNGSFNAIYGSFGTVGEEATVGIGNAKWGNFLSVNSTRSGRFLDTPEFQPLHTVGNNQTIFDRIDYQPNATDVFHLNLFAARNWFQTPNTYDQLNQDQRQRALTFNIAPGYQHIFNAHTLLTFHPFVRRDDIDYYPSRDPLDDSPATLQQRRTLTNYGFRGDISYVHGIHDFKFGTQIMQTRLDETFGLGLTDPGFNAICIDADGAAQGLPSVASPERCEGLGFLPNPDLQPGLVPFDLTRGGGLFHFRGTGNVNEYAFYAQDQITLGAFNVSAGLRVDQYNGLSSDNGVQPRIGISYLLKSTGTVLRASYARTFETPYNENLLISSATGEGGLATNVFGAFSSKPLEPGRRNQFSAGLQQALKRFFVVDADYFWKYTDNAFDFDTLFNTPVQFPISWRKSKIDGVAIRISTPNIGGFQAFSTMGHTRARFFGPEVGGLIFNSPINTGVFRIDHDQAFQQTTHLRYQHSKDGPWMAFTWRYDSGLVAGEVPDMETALALTAAQQSAIGLFCGSQQAALGSPIASCTAANFGATRIRIPAPGTADDDHNPPRISPRHLFDLAVGTDNLFHTERLRTTARFTVQNLTNKEALYNFLSTFSGTHFVTPRAYQAELGFVF